MTAGQIRKEGEDGFCDGVFLRWGRKAFFVFLRCWLLLVAALYFLQERMIYPGASMWSYSLESEETRRVLREYGAEPWRDSGGRYVGLVQKSRVEARASLLVFYGNGDSALNTCGWLRNLDRVAEDGRFDYYTMEFPGYGAREGNLGEKSVVGAAALALEEVGSRGKPVYVMGLSIGSGVAAAAVARHPEIPSGVLLWIPFDRLESAARQRLLDVLGPFARLIPLNLLLKDRYDSVSNLAAYRGRIGIISGGKDGVCPAPLGEALARTLKGAVSRVVIPEMHHQIWYWNEEAVRVFRFVTEAR